MLNTRTTYIVTDWLELNYPPEVTTEDEMTAWREEVVDFLHARGISDAYHHRNGYGEIRWSHGRDPFDFLPAEIGFDYWMAVREGRIVGVYHVDQANRLTSTEPGVMVTP